MVARGVGGSIGTCRFGGRIYVGYSSGGRCLRSACDRQLGRKELLSGWKLWLAVLVKGVVVRQSWHFQLYST